MGLEGRLSSGVGEGFNNEIVAASVCGLAGLTWESE